MDLKKMYEENQDFKEYVDRYVLNKRITVEAALKLAIIREYADYLLKR